MKQCVMAIDLGTTSTRVILFDHGAKTLSTAQKELKQLYPHPGWHWHDPIVQWELVRELMDAALKKANLTYADVAAIGIDSHRESTVVWNKNTGEPYYPMIVWGSRQSVEQTDRWNADKDFVSRVRARTGMTINPSFSASKVVWLLEHVAGFREEVAKGNVLFGNPDTWIIWNLSRGEYHVTDASMASRTMMVNLATCDWDRELMAEMNIPEELILPKILPSSGVMAYTDPSLTGGVAIPIAGDFGDQQAGTFGQTIFTPMTGKTSYGTCFVSDFNIGTKPITGDEMKCTTSVGWKIGNEVTYVVDAIVLDGGSFIQWLRDGLRMIQSAEESNVLAARVPNSLGMYMVPAMAGTSSPHWNDYARTTFVGITAGVTKEHFCRAALESLCLQVRDNIEATSEALKTPFTSMNADGGAAKSDFLMQMQADILGIPVLRPTELEMTALGAAYAAGLGVGFWKDLDEIKKFWTLDRVFEPQRSADERESLYDGWKRAVVRAFDWARPEDLKRD